MRPNISILPLRPSAGLIGMLYPKNNDSYYDLWNSGNELVKKTEYRSYTICLEEFVIGESAK